MPLSSPLRWRLCATLGRNDGAFEAYLSPCVHPTDAPAPAPVEALSACTRSRRQAEPIEPCYGSPGEDRFVQRVAGAAALGCGRDEQRPHIRRRLFGRGKSHQRIVAFCHPGRPSDDIGLIAGGRYPARRAQPILVYRETDGMHGRNVAQSGGADGAGHKMLSQCRALLRKGGDSGVPADTGVAWNAGAGRARHATLTPA